MASIEHQTQQAGAHLMVNTFGRAVLYYNDKEMADSELTTQQPIGTPDFKFLVRVNRNGTFDIQRRDGVVFSVTVEMHVKIFQIQARAEDLLIPPWYRLSGDILYQKFSQRPAEYAESHFRNRLMPSPKVFRRVDVRFLQSSWVTILVHDQQIMSVCVNGQRQLNALQVACEAISPTVNEESKQKKSK